MNKVILMGRLTRDPETRYSQGASGTAVTRYGLAVNRSYKREGEPDADFINIVAFGNRGEFAGKYFKKGMMVAVVGELRTGSYTDKEGNKRYTTDVVVTEQYFAESRASFESRGQGGYSQGSNADFAPAGAGYQTAPAQNYQQQAYQQPQAQQQVSYQQPQQNYQQPQQGGYQNAPQAQPQQAPAAPDGFMPIDTDIEGDEDLPF